MLIRNGFLLTPEPDEDVIMSRNMKRNPLKVRF